MNIGTIIMSVVLLAIMCSPIFIFRAKNGKRGKEDDKKDEQKKED